MHDWVAPSNPTLIWDMNDIGASAGLIPSNMLRIGNKRDAPSPFCDLPLAGYRNVLVRVQRDPVAKRFVCELWNYDGTGHTLAAFPLTSFLDWPYSGGAFGGQYTTVSLGFYRVFTSVVPDGSQPPVTAVIGDLTDLKFDGNTLDDSGHRHNVDIRAPFVKTPDQKPIAIIKTSGAPVWSNWVSFRAGHPGVLDATASFSLADAGGKLTYQWQQLSGPTSLKWSDQTGAKPTVEGMIFGNYRFRLQITDASGTTASTELDIGAVATDDNGVVVNGNPAADLIFGPMIAFGRNPWRWQDYLTLHSASLRKPELDRISPPPWATDLSGTITYSPYWPGTPNQTTLCSAVPDGTATSITVCDISKLVGISYPAIVELAASANGEMEEVIVDSAVGNVLHVPYNGRGFHRKQYGHVAAPQAWPKGSLVNMQSTVGTGTHFLTDFCPAGVGEEGQIAYGAGTVGVTAGSPVLTGTKTSWDGTLVSLRVRIQGTHAGGTPFVFFATVASVNSGASITMDMPWPSDADSPLAGLSYAILRGGRYLVRRYTRPDGSTGMQQDPVSACMSDTLMYHSGSDNIPVALTTCTPTQGCPTQKGKTYAYSDSVWTSEFTINYYDEVLAHYAGYFRSGLNLFRDNARKVGDYWPTMPLMDEGYVNNAPRDTGLTGVVAAAVLDNVPGHDTSRNWYTIRKLATSATASVTKSDCNNYLREVAYQLSWVGLAAMFDPDPRQKAHWQAVLQDAYTRDKGCLVKGNTFYNASPVGNKGTFTMSHGSPSLTGTGFNATLCPTVGSGTIGSIKPGDTHITGTGFISQPAGKIVISALRGGAPYRFYSQYTFKSATDITLTTPFDGDAGSSYGYVIESDLLVMSFGNPKLPTYETDVNTMYTCTYVDSSHITLDRGWEGASGTYYATRNISGDVGYGNNPFQVGIKVLAMKYASLGATGDTAAGYTAMNQAVANWVLTDGFDPVTKGMYYLRGVYNCEPPGILKPGCGYGPGSEESARFLNGEAQNAMSVAYLANPTTRNRDFGDQFYGGQWGKPGYGPYGSFPLPWSDGIYLDVLNDDAYFRFKWIGFLFGIGMAHQWPAVRLGGVQPAKPATVSIPVDFGGVPGAVRAQIAVTQPSSATATYSCTNSPCQVTVDQRQGTHWYQIAYLDANNAVVTQGQPALLPVQPNGISNSR